MTRQPTGNALFACFRPCVIPASFRHIEQVIAVTLTDWSGKALSERSTLPVTSVSLVSGKWGWTPLPDAPVPILESQRNSPRRMGHRGKTVLGPTGDIAPAADLGHEVSVHKGNVFWFSGPGNSSGSRSCLLNGSKLPEHRHFMDRPPLPYRRWLCH